MAQWFLNLGAIWVPVGVVFLFYGLDQSGKDNPNWLVVWVAFVAGIGIGLAGSIALTKAYDRLRRQDYDDRQHFAELMGELRGLRSDMNGGTHGSSDSERTDDS